MVISTMSLSQADIDDGDDVDLGVPAKDSRHLSPFTVVHYQHLFRDLIAETMLESSGGYMVGGPGCTLEVDESCFGNNVMSLICYVSVFKARGNIDADVYSTVFKCGYWVELLG